MKLLAISGRKGSGKSTVARSVCDLQWVYSFAAPIKGICETVFGLDGGILHGSDEDKNKPTTIPWSRWPTYVHFRPGMMTHRQVMQEVGTLFRTIDEDVWVKACLRRIQASNPDIAVIDDLRYSNELDAIKAAGGKVIRLTRGIDGDPHPSETELKDIDPRFDLVVPNHTMSLDDTLSAVRQPLQTWGWVDA